MNKLNMNKTKTESVYKRLVIGFGIAGVSVIILSIVAIISSAYISKQLKKFYESPFTSVGSTWEVRRSLLEVEKTLYKSYIVNGTQDIKIYQELVDTEAKNLVSTFEMMTTSFLGDKSLIDNIAKKLQETEPYKNQAIELMKNRKDIEALDILFNKYIPALDDVSLNLAEMSKISTDIAKGFVEVSDLISKIIIVSFILLSIIVIVLLYVLAKKITKSIVSPIVEIEGAVSQLSKGNLSVDIEYKSNDELGWLAHSTRETIRELEKYIKNETEVLQKMADKDLNVNVDVEFLGDFAPIKKSILSIIDSFNTMIYKIREASIQVKEGSNQIASISQILAEGSTDQSSSVEELLATVNEVTEHVEINAKNAEHVSSLSTDSMNEIEKGNKYMQNLLEAMSDITNSSQEISNIIKVIDSIATQTNLLSLNASIEAARAGENGAGFAVVANEIGKLANECGEAARNTTELISNSIKTVEEGSKLADETADVLKNVVNSSDETNKLVGEISIACAQQATSLEEILQGIQQIANVVESNSATAQQSSASSQELLAQAEMLTQLLKEYKLKRN